MELEEGGDLFDEEAPARKQKKKKGAKKRRTVEEEQEEEEELEPEEVAGLQVGLLVYLWCETCRYSLDHVRHEILLDLMMPAKGTAEADKMSCLRASQTGAVSSQSGAMHCAASVELQTWAAARPPGCP